MDDEIYTWTDADHPAHGYDCNLTKDAEFRTDVTNEIKAAHVLISSLKQYRPDETHTHTH